MIVMLKWGRNRFFKLVGLLLLGFIFLWFLATAVYAGRLSSNFKIYDVPLFPVYLAKEIVNDISLSGKAIVLNNSIKSLSLSGENVFPRPCRSASSSICGYDLIGVVSEVHEDNSLVMEVNGTKVSAQYGPESKVLLLPPGCTDLKTMCINNSKMLKTGPGVVGGVFGDIKSGEQIRVSLGDVSKDVSVFKIIFVTLAK